MLSLPAMAQTDFTFTAPDICPVDPVAYATVELIAGAKDARVMVERRGYEVPVVVTYNHNARSVTLDTRGDGSVRYTLQEDQQAAISVSVTGPDGKSVETILAPELGFAYLATPEEGVEKSVHGLKSGIFQSILAPKDVPDGPAGTVRRLALSADDDTDQCGPSAAICTSRFNRMIGDGFLCAVSLGGDLGACNGANEAKCAWCECKGYACQGCD
ncbi:hypothetical protein [Marinovum sp. KMM 9989]